MTSHRPDSKLLYFVIRSVGLSFAVALPLLAAPPRGVAPAGGQEKKPPEAGRNEPARAGGKTANSAKGWIKGFAPAKGDEEDLIGILKFLPEEKNAKIL